MVKLPARQLLQDQPDIIGDKIEAVGPVSVSNMLEFEGGAREVEEIDAQYSQPRRCLCEPSTEFRRGVLYRPGQ